MLAACEPHLCGARRIAEVMGFRLPEYPLAEREAEVAAWAAKLLIESRPL
jgi:hypothetical protein